MTGIRGLEVENLTKRIEHENALRPIDPFHFISFQRNHKENEQYEESLKASHAFQNSNPPPFGE